MLQRILKVLMVGVALSGWSLAKYSEQSVQVTETSVEGQNIKNAAEIVRRLGSPEKADNILAMLKEGRIYWDPTLKENGDTDNSGWSKDMTLSGSMVRWESNPALRGKPFDPDSIQLGYPKLLDLARTLCHEKVHVHQWRSGHVWKSLLSLCYTHEYDAWTDTILHISKWVRTAQREYFEADDLDRVAKIKALERLIAVGKLLAGALNGLVDNNHFAWFDGPEFWKECEKLANADVARWERELEQLKGGERRVSSATLKSVLPTPFPRLRLPDEGEFAVRLVGNDRAAGDIFTVSLINQSDYPAEICLMEGDVLVPSDPAYQRMMVGRNAHVTVPARSESELHLDGFCLDPGKFPPPSDPMKCSYTPTETEPFRGLQEIVKVGNRLARAGKYAKDIQSAEKYRTTVIERALWFTQTCDGPKPYDKSKLTEDLFHQVEKLPEEKRPTAKETEKVAGRIWDDVDLTCKTAASAPHHPAR